MKIKRIDTIGFIRPLKMANSFSSPKHKIEYVAELDGYLIDDICLIPVGRVEAVIVERTETLKEVLKKVGPSLKISEEDAIGVKTVEDLIKVAKELPKKSK